jgi:hypothetical protein
MLLSADLTTRLHAVVSPASAHSASAHSTSAHVAPATFARFSGSWQTHGGGVYIGPGGKGEYQLRTYVNCTQTILTDCDRIKGNVIYPGGFGTFALTRVAGNTVYGSMTNSSTSWEINTPISFRLTSRDVLIAKGPSDLLGQRNFCGPHAPAGACGA